MRVPVEREVPQWWPSLKRATDLVLGGMLLILAAPVVALAAIAILFVTGGTPFFAQERVGMNGRRFKMFKLRTMVAGAHAMRESVMHLNEVDGPVFKIRNDPRLHPLGHFLRRTSIDELPNLLNVIARRHVAGRAAAGAAERGRALRRFRVAPPERAARA